MFVFLILYYINCYQSFHFLPPQYLNVITVWLIGSSYLARARCHVQDESLGVSDGCLWLTRSGMRWAELAPLVEAQVRQTNKAPRALILHLGSNDLGQSTTCGLYHDMFTSLLRIRLLLPTTTIIWSDMLARLYWRTATCPIRLEVARNKLNRRIGNRVAELCGVRVEHTLIVKHDTDLYAWDGVHLSRKGMDIFLQDITTALRATMN